MDQMRNVPIVNWTDRELNQLRIGPIGLNQLLIGPMGLNQLRIGSIGNWTNRELDPLPLKIWHSINSELILSLE